MTHRPLGRRRWLVLTLTTSLLLLGAAGGSASAATTAFTNSAPITIPDSGTSTPYPSTINANVPGLAGNIQKTTVTLRDLDHTYLNDLKVLLVAPSGAKSILMDNVGGSDDPGTITLVFDQSSPFALNSSDTAVSGTFRPSEDSPSSDLSPPAPPGPYPVNLDVFNNTSPNGVWRLFIEDDTGGDSGTLPSWTLNLTTPVNTLTAGKPKLNKKKGTAQVPVTVADAGQLTLSGKGVKTASATKSKAVAGPGTVKLTVKPKGKTSKKLSSTGKATVKAKITFTPNGGTSSVTTKKIKLKKTL
jgi:large repetitive protein